MNANLILSHTRTHALSLFLSYCRFILVFILACLLRSNKYNIK